MFRQMFLLSFSAACGFAYFDGLIFKDSEAIGSSGYHSPDLHLAKDVPCGLPQCYSFAGSRALVGLKNRLRLLRRRALGKWQNLKMSHRGLFGDLIDTSVMLTTGVIRGSAKLTKDVIRGSAKAVLWLASKAIRVGKHVIHVPIQGVELTINGAWAMTKLGAGVTNQILSDTADWFQGNWEAVKAVEFPGKNLILLMYPTGLMTVVNSATKELVYVMDKAHEQLTYTFVYMLYSSLKIVFGAVTTVIKMSNLECVTLPGQKVAIQRDLIDMLSYGKATLCGIADLKPVNNITITRNDKKFLIVHTPWVLENISVRLKGVTANSTIGAVGRVINDETLVATIDKVKAVGTVAFQAGTILRFFRLLIKVEKMEGLKIEFPTKEKNAWMEGIEGLSNQMSGIVVKELNHIFKKMEKKVFDYITNV